MAKQAPQWLQEAKNLCARENIETAGWGDESLVVYAKSPEHSGRIERLLADLGFKRIPDVADDDAGLMTLSMNG